MIRLENIHLAYTAGDRTIPVLEDASLEIGSGESLAIMGPSGSGKTSLLLVMTGLESPDSGSIVFDDTPLDTLSSDARADLRRDRIGIVFQNFHLIPSLSACENVALPMDIAGERGARDHAASLLDRVGLGHRKDHYPNAMSGGERQRVAIARALIQRPSLVVADEPTGNLDNQTGDTIADLLFELNQENDATLVLVTHDPSLAGRCQRRVRLHEGQLHPAEQYDV
ncbi:MAG: ABC transporter ATP-binding protein [Acidiferrobacterales bacterium]|nr:ABC transporter ATP-binding protein [Acidiferrobacterales bacterium]